MFKISSFSQYFCFLFLCITVPLISLVVFFFPLPIYTSKDRNLPNLPKDGDGKLSSARHTEFSGFPFRSMLPRRFSICPSLFVDQAASSSGIY